MRTEQLTIEVDGQQIHGTLAAPATLLPGCCSRMAGEGSQEKDIAVSKEIAALGCVCLTVDLRGHARTEHQRDFVTREHNLHDILGAYDILARQPIVDISAIAVVGSSYGGYLATLLSTLRPVRWLALRAPALYRDEGWRTPKASLDKMDLAVYRRTQIAAAENRALGACSEFTGDVLLVRSEHDTIVPEPVIANYVAAFRNAHSLTYRVLDGADHALSEPEHRNSYNRALIAWTTEMILGAR